MIPVYSRQQWGARAPKSVSIMATPTEKLWLHHSADDRTGVSAVQDHQRFHMDSRGYQDIAYSVLGDSDRLYVGRGVGVVGGHTAGQNSSSHAVCMLGNFDARHPSQAELDTAAWAAVWLWRNGATTKPAYTGGHRDAPGATTACPGRFLHAQIPEINARAARFAQGVTVELSEQDIKWLQHRLNVWGGAKLAVDGKLGPTTTSAIKAFQQSEGLTPSGEPSLFTVVGLLAGRVTPIVDAKIAAHAKTGHGDSGDHVTRTQLAAELTGYERTGHGHDLVGRAE